MTYPISEIFHSVQGEGRWTGTPMLFVRLAGCNVGRYEQPETAEEARSPLGELCILNPKHSICTTYDGQKFLCDTDYHALLGQWTSAAIAAELKLEDHICITGGEPFLHDLKPLINSFNSLNNGTGIGMVHIETSGTIEPPLSVVNYESSAQLWITCCPKRIAVGKPLVIPYDVPDEWKILVGPEFDREQFEQMDELIPWTVEEKYLQPINGVHQVWQENLGRCLKLLEEFPHWKLSAQLHKYLEVR